MRVLFDQGTPVPLRAALSGYTVTTAYERGWSSLQNGELLAAAEIEFDVFVTTDKSLRYQQNLAGRQLAILVLPFASWPRLSGHVGTIAAAIDGMQPGDFIELTLDSI